MHVCGDVDNLGQTPEIPMDIIDCEFAGIRKNLEVSRIQIWGKKIGFDVVDTNRTSGKFQKKSTPPEGRNEIIGADNSW